MAQFELTLLDWAENHKGSRQYVAFADKCWPAFPSQFGFEPCYVNSRLATRGIPVACEVDIYGRPLRVHRHVHLRRHRHLAGHQQLRARLHVRGPD